MLTRECKTCGVVGPIQDFPPQKGGKHGRRPHCRACFNSRPNKKKRRYIAHPANARRAWLKSKYGLTEAKYHDLLVSQFGVCAICGALPEQSIKGSLAVDHDHNTGQVRGLLCGQCNTGIGKLKDNAALLRKAADYLERTT